MTELVYERTISNYPGLILSRFINALIGIVELFLILRLAFELLAANPASPFVAWLYEFTDVLTGPFRGAFANISIQGFTVDIAVILAMIAYMILGVVLSWILSLFIDTAY